MHLNSKLLFERYAKQFFKNHIKVLEIGPDAFPSTFRKSVNNDTIDWQTLDIYKSEQLTYVADNEYKFPIPDNTFDIVLSGQVIEHVRKIWVWIKELNRVCKVDGKVITIAPTSWPFHEAPIDCWRIYPEGMNTLYEEAGLKIDLCKFETLETDCLRGTLPGTGALIVDPSDKKAAVKSLIKNIVRRPATSSFDTIAIGTKKRIKVMAKILDLGCGNRKLPGATGIDINPDTDADIVHDLDKFPYPFEDSTFDEVSADNVVEHLDNIIAVMEELHRISKPGALIKIMVPYFRSRWAFVDPTHKHFFTVESFSYFDPTHIHNRLFNYSKVKFRVEKVLFNEGIVHQGMLRTLMNPFKTIANKYPFRYERYLSHILPLDELTFMLRTIK